MASFDEIANKKIFGVKALYLVGGFVIILAIVAWKIKPSKPTDSGTETTDKNTGAAPTPNPYDSANPDGNGTVTVVQGQLGPTSGDTSTPYTSEDWAKEGATWIANHDEFAATGPQAYAALEKYLTGQDRSFEEQQWVDAWFKQKGAPPDAPQAGGTVSAPAGKQQITPPGYHKVTGVNDNTYSKLAQIYYGHNDPGTVALIKGSNVDTLGQIDGFSVGTRVFIPAFHLAVWYTLPSNMTRDQICAKNGITSQQFIALNTNNANRSSFKKGETVRVK